MNGENVSDIDVNCTVMEEISITSEVKRTENKMLDKIRAKAVTFKISMVRSMAWISIAQFLLIIMANLMLLQDKGLEFDLKIWGIPIALTIFLILFLLGYAEIKMGFFKEEQEQVKDNTPYVKEIMIKLDEIKEKLDRAEKHEEK